jgi:selenium metabolism protein YedF
MQELDCRGLACPQPVLTTKDALAEINAGYIRVILDNPAARDNVTRFARSQGCDVDISRRAPDYILTITKGSPTTDVSPQTATAPEKPRLVVRIAGQYMGQGDDKLGRILMKAFLGALKDSSHEIQALVFYNSGVYLTIEGSDCLDAIMGLEKSGVHVLSCGTCLDFYNLKDKLRVGVISNMFEIIETLSGANRILSP